MKKIKNYEELVFFVSGLTESHVDDAIILYDIGKYYIAIGDAAVSLYKIYRWDFRETHCLVKNCLFSLVTEDGLTCLRNKNIGFTTRRTDYRCDADVDTNYSDTQQFLDLLRCYVKEGTFYEYPLIQQTVVLDSPDMQRIARITSLVVDHKSVSVELDGRDTYPLVYDMTWNYKQVAVALMHSLHSIIEQQHDLMLGMARDKDSIEKTIKGANTFIYQLYSYCKSAHVDEVVVVKQRGFFISFDDDAIVVSDKLSLPLYECQTFGLRNHTATVMSISEFDSLTAMDVDIHAIATEHIRDMYEYGLTSKVILNETYDKTIGYEDTAIIKDVAGNYLIRATYGATKFEPVTISNLIGMYILCLDDRSLERKRMLACVAHQTYDKKVSSIRQQQLQEEG